jgi:hypothetical protein
VQELGVSAQEIIDQIRALPPIERAKITQYVREEDDSIVPESFKAAMRAAAEGRFVDMDTALNEDPPSHLR